MSKAAFFDRDGTVIREMYYLSNIDDIELLPPALELCRLLQNHDYRLMMVTNQSGVARDYFDEAFVQKTHTYLDKLLKQEGVFFEGWYYCPHHPIEAVIKSYLQDCECRKPKPGMLVQAAQDFSLDLSRSLMFGDSSRDLEAGEAAGCYSFDITKFLSLSGPEIENFLKKKQII